MVCMNNTRLYTTPLNIFIIMMSNFDNNNQLPEALIRAFDARSNASLEEQLNALFEESRMRGVKRVDYSAYFKQCPSERPGLYQYSIDGIESWKKEEGNEHNLVFLWNAEDVTMMGSNNIEELNLLNPNSSFDVLNELKQRICALGEGEEKEKEMEALRKMYKDAQESGRKGRGSRISKDLLDQLEMLHRAGDICQAAKEHQEIHNRRWKYAKRCMQLVNDRSAESTSRKYANVLLCEEGVASGAAELMISGMASEVALDNIYAPDCEVGSYEAMRRVCDKLRQRFGEECIIINVTSNRKRGQYPMLQWPIRSHQSIKELYKAQRDHLLK